MTPYLLIVLLCMCDFSSVKKEILRILALNSECENTSSVLVGPFCASTGLWEPGATALKLLPESTQAWRCAVEAGGSCACGRVLMPLGGPFGSTQAETGRDIERAVHFSENWVRIAHLI